MLKNNTYENDYSTSIDKFCSLALHTMGSFFALVMKPYWSSIFPDVFVWLLKAKKKNKAIKEKKEERIRKNKRKKEKSKKRIWKNKRKKEKSKKRIWKTKRKNKKKQEYEKQAETIRERLLLTTF